MNPMNLDELTGHVAERHNELLAGITAERARRAPGVGVLRRLTCMYRGRPSSQPSAVAVAARTADTT